MPHPASDSVLTRPQGPSTKYLKPVYFDFAQTKQGQDVIDRGSKYILPVYARAPFVLSHGKGMWVWDTAGRKYLDFSAGIAVNALGHADEGVLKVRAQVRGISYVGLTSRRYCKIRLENCSMQATSTTTNMREDSQSSW